MKTVNLESEKLNTKTFKIETVVQQWNISIDKKTSRSVTPIVSYPEYNKVAESDTHIISQSARDEREFHIQSKVNFTSNGFRKDTTLKALITGKLEDCIECEPVISMTSYHPLSNKKMPIALFEETFGSLSTFA